MKEFSEKNIPEEQLSNSEFNTIQMRKILNTGNLEEASTYIKAWKAVQPKSKYMYEAYIAFLFQAMRKEKKDNTSKVLWDGFTIKKTVWKECQAVVKRALKIAPTQFLFHKASLDLLLLVQDLDALAAALVTLMEEMQNPLFQNDENYKLNQELLWSAIADYQDMIYNNMALNETEAFGVIAQACMKYYPHKALGYMHYSFHLMSRKAYQQGLEMLHKAHQVEPEMETPIYNLANIYEQLGQKERAMYFYIKLSQSPNEETQKVAQQRLEQLIKTL